MKTRHLGFVAAVVSLIVIPIGLAAKLPVDRPMPALRGANAWVNSKPLSTADLRGKGSEREVAELVDAGDQGIELSADVLQVLDGLRVGLLP